LTLSVYDFDNGKTSTEALRLGGFDTYTVSDDSELLISTEANGETAR